MHSGRFAGPTATLSSLGGLWRNRRQRLTGNAVEPYRVLAFIAVCALSDAGSIVLFFVTDRYRVPAMPWLIVLATFTCGHFLVALRQRQRARVLAVAAAAAALFWLTDANRLNLDRARIQRDVRVHSLFVGNFFAEWQDRFLAEMTDWLRDRRIVYREDVYEGLACAPRAFRAMLAGDNLGKTLVRVAG